MQNMNSSSSISSSIANPTTNTNRKSSDISSIDIDYSESILVCEKNNISNKGIKIIMVLIMIIMIIGMEIIMMTVLKSNGNKKELYEYKMMKYDIHINIQSNKSDEKMYIPVEGVIVKDKMVRKHSFYDEGEGVYGYIIPINSPNVEEEYEYKIEGECHCCVECFNDDNCQSGLVCKDSICVECNNLNDCIENQVCNEYGKCLKSGSCGSNDDCNTNEYCDSNGECINGCINDKNCKSNEVCINSQCRYIGCNDNFDCNDYNHVCIDSECVFIDDNSKSCFNDNYCNDDDGYYCNYEYLICVKDNTVGTMVVNRRNNEVLPTVAACTLYGVISLFVVVSTQSIISNLAKDKLQNQCDQQCSSNYLMFSEGKVKKYEYSLEHKIKNWNKRNSECTGKCKPNQQLKNTGAINYSESLCHEKTYTDIVTAYQKDIYLQNHNRYDTPTKSVFRTMLSLFCKSFFYSYHDINSRGRREFFTRYACSSDRKSVRCKYVKV